MPFNFSRPKFGNSATALSGKDFIRKSATLDFPSVAAAASSVLTIAVAGVTTSDDTLVQPSVPVAGLVYQSWVSAADTVSVRVTNVTAAPIDAASSVHRVIVFKA